MEKDRKTHKQRKKKKTADLSMHPYGFVTISALPEIQNVTTAKRDWLLQKRGNRNNRKHKKIRKLLNRMEPIEKTQTQKERRDEKKTNGQLKIFRI